jgi:hypothetical protein
MTSWCVEHANMADAAEIARLLRCVVPEHLLNLTIWGSPLFYRYCEDSLLSQDSAAPRYYVLRSNEGVGGVISLRRIDSEIVLDTAYVLPALRSDFLSMQLLYEAVQCECQDCPVDWVTWDVFSGRPRLEVWHRSLGGREESRKGWWLRGPDTSEGYSESSALVLRLAESEEQYARWGFSSFEIQTASHTYRVGRLPGRTFRLTNGDAASDRELLSALRDVDALSSILLMGPVERPDSSWTEITVLKRYRAPLITYLAALAQFF